jgi:NAD(P)-dependent dehydrogenase (short-subunit alcohol dehydrogenase family)
MRMKTVLITGSNRGIGKALTDYYLEQDYTVFAGVRQMPENITTHPALQHVVLDIEDDTSIRSAIAIVKAKIGTLDVLINNAGISKGSSIDGKPEEVSELASLDRSRLLRMMDVNTISPIMVTKYALPLMTNSNSFVVNISSLRATYENSKDGNGSYGYSSSKLALNMMTLCLAHDLPNNIATFAVHPGSVETDMNPHGSMQPKESAEAIAHIIEHWKSDMNGKFLNYDDTPLH